MIDGTNINFINANLNNDQKAEAFYHFTQIYNLCNKKDYEFSEILRSQELMMQLYPDFEQLIVNLTLSSQASNDNWIK